MVSYTPAPWRVEADIRTEVDAFSVEHRLREYVAGYNIVSDSGEIVGCEGILSGDRENADLIAAAPELLQALRWFIDDIDGTHTVMLDFDKNVERARAAIAKALGQS